jgi:hypothetical protein
MSRIGLLHGIHGKRPDRVGHVLMRRLLYCLVLHQIRVLENSVHISTSCVVAKTARERFGRPTSLSSLSHNDESGSDQLIGFHMENAANHEERASASRRAVRPFDGPTVGGPARRSKATIKNGDRYS